MKHLFLLASLAILFSFTHNSGEGLSPLAVGEKAPMSDVQMKNIDGSMVSLESAVGKKGLLVVFSSNTCPFVVGNPGAAMEGWEGRYPAVAGWCAKADVSMILVNSNEARRMTESSFDQMVARAESQSYSFPYLLDQNHALADAFGARTTPHIYLFDKDLVLKYRGAIDDNYKSAKNVKETYLKDALKSLSKGKSIEVSETPAKGCTIKRLKN